MRSSVTIAPGDKLTLAASVTRDPGADTSHVLQLRAEMKTSAEHDPTVMITIFYSP